MDNQQWQYINNYFFQLYIYDMHGDSMFSVIPHHDSHSFSCIDFFEEPVTAGCYHITVGDMRGSLQFLVSLELELGWAEWYLLRWWSVTIRVRSPSTRAIVFVVCTRARAEEEHTLRTRIIGRAFLWIRWSYFFKTEFLKSIDFSVRWYRNPWKNDDRKTDHTVIREENAIMNMAMHPSEQ